MVACSASHLPTEVAEIYANTSLLSHPKNATVTSGIDRLWNYIGDKVETRHMEKRSPLIPFPFPLAKKKFKLPLLGKPFALAGAPKLLKKAPGPLKKLGPAALLAGGSGLGGLSLPSSIPAKPAIGGKSSSPAIPAVGALKGKGGLLKIKRRKGSLGRGNGSSNGRSNQSGGSHRTRDRVNQSGGTQRKNSHSKEENKKAAAVEEVTTRAPTEEEKEAALQAQAAMEEARAAIQEAQATMQEVLAAMAARRGLPQGGLINPLETQIGRK